MSFFQHTQEVFRRQNFFALKLPKADWLFFPILISVAGLLCMERGTLVREVQTLKLQLLILDFQQKTLVK